MSTIPSIVGRVSAVLFSFSLGGYPQFLFCVSAHFEKTARAYFDALATFFAIVECEREVHAGTDFFEPGEAAWCAKHRALFTAQAGATGEAPLNFRQEDIFRNGGNNLREFRCQSLLHRESG